MGKIIKKPGQLIERVRNRQWCADNARQIAEIDERLAARNRLSEAILDDKRDTFHRISADIRARADGGFFATDDVHALSALCFGGPV